MNYKQEIEELENLSKVAEINLFLDKFRKTIRLVEKEDHSNHNKVLLDLLEATIKQKVNGNASKSIYDKERSGDKRNYVSAILSWVLESSTQLHTNQKFQSETLKLFEWSFSNSKWLKLPNGFNRISQFEKLLTYQQSIRQQVERIKTDLGTIYSIEDTNKLSNNINKIINSDYFKLLFKPLLTEKSCDKNSINKIFVAISKYTIASPIEKNYYFERAKQRIVNQINSFVYDDFISKIISSPYIELFNLLTEDYERCPHSKPAQLELGEIRKKFLLNQNDRLHKVPISILKHKECFAKTVIVQFETKSKSVTILNPKQEYSNFIAPSIDFYLEIKQEAPIDSLDIKYTLMWENVDDSIDEVIKTISLKEQESNIDWESLALQDPYNFEPVEEEELLIGRESIITRIFPKLTGKRISSFFLLGQKRVGKTSIAKTILNKLKNFDSDAILIYKETGDFKYPSAAETANELGYIICKSIKSRSQKYMNIQIPEFKGSLNRLSGFVDEIHIIDPNQKIIIALDEFDEIDPSLYLKGPEGDSFFLTLRAISNKDFVSFILVGGEKMRIILDSQGEQINKFESIEVDYFNAATIYTDYNDLITNPVPDFEYEKESISLLHKYTAGNPYFSKNICNRIFKFCINERDCHITKEETHRAISAVMSEAKANSFSHFWEDGIKGIKEKEEIVTMGRKKFLLGYAKALEGSSKLTKSIIFDSCRYRGLDDSESESILNEFIDRKIIVEKDDTYRILVKFFEKWLVGFGQQEILLTFSDEDRILQYQRDEEEARVKAIEIRDLVNSWGNYKGKKVNENDFRRWLEQFDDHFQQRFIFKLTSNLKFYDEVEVQSKLTSLFRKIQKKNKNLKGTKTIYTGEKTTGRSLQRLKRNNFLVSYVDGIGKSGAYYAKKFADENNINSRYVMEPSKVFSKLSQLKNGIDSIIFVDDFIGTGNSINTNLTKFLNDNIDFLHNFPDLTIHIAIIVGYSDSKYRIESSLSNVFSNLYIHIEDILNDSDMTFSDQSRIFASYAEKERIRLIAQSYGSKLSRQFPLGYGHCQSLVVLPDTCPNNTLPIYWKKTSKWIPLFRRNTN